jgi:hypothetical protein
VGSGVLDASARACLWAPAFLTLVGCDPGWALKGSARSETGEPVLGAIAETICPRNDPPRPTAIADANGEFRGTGLGSFREECSVEVRATGYAAQRFPVPPVCTLRAHVFGCVAAMGFSECDLQLGRSVSIEQAKQSTRGAAQMATMESDLFEKWQCARARGHQPVSAAMFTEAWTVLLASGGVKCVPIPAHSPNCNPHAERSVKTIRNECLDPFVILGERHLRHLIKEFGEHYLTERHHQGIGSQIIRPKPSPSNDNATLRVVGCRSRLGGLLRYYSREAA